MGALSEFARGYLGVTEDNKGEIVDRKLSSEERKVLLSYLSQLDQAIARAQRQYDESAIELLQERAKIYNSDRKLVNQILTTSMNNQGKLQVEQLKAQAADVRNLRDNRVKALTTINNRGMNMYERIVAQYLDPTVVSSAVDRANVVWSVLAEMPATAATYVAMRQAQDAFGSPPVKASAKFAAAESAYKQSKKEADNLTQYSLKLDEGQSLTPTELKNFALILQQPANISAPTLADARLELGAGPDVTDLKEQKKDIKAQLDMLQREAGSSGIRNPTIEELGLFADSPQYRAWAEARGFRLGERRDNGSYVPGRGDMAAYWAAQAERQGKTMFSRANKLGGEVEIQLGGQSEAVKEPVTLPDMVDVSDTIMLVKDKDTNETVLVNLLTEEQNVVLDAEGKPTAFYAQFEATPGVKEAVAKMTPPPVDETIPATIGTIKGKEIPPAWGDDPAKTKRVAVRDGNTTYEVVLKRNEAGQWEERERKEAPRFNFAVLPDIRLPEFQPRKDTVVAEVKVPKPVKEELPAPVVAQPMKAAPLGEKPMPDEVVAPDQRGKPSGALPPVKAARQVPPILTEEEIVNETPMFDAENIKPNPIEEAISVDTEGAALDRKVAKMQSGEEGVSGFTPEDAAKQQQLAIQQAKDAVAMTRTPVKPTVAPSETPEQRRLRILKQFGGTIGSTATKNKE